MMQTIHYMRLVYTGIEGLRGGVDLIQAAELYHFHKVCINCEAFRLSSSRPTPCRCFYCIHSLLILYAVSTTLVRRKLLAHFGD